MVRFEIEPYDVLFFGSGKQFNIGSQDMHSIFPPFPHTLAGSICARIYAKKGINVSNIIKEVYGPFLKLQDRILFPKPMDILKERKKEEDYDISQAILILRKNQNSGLINSKDTDLECNLKGLLWQKSKEDKDFEPFRAFITQEGLKSWLSNSSVGNSEIINLREVFSYESRVGIHINSESQTVSEEDGLYRIDFVRLNELKDVKLVFFVEFDYENDELKKAGTSDNELIEKVFNSYPRVLKLGGETRMVRYEVEKEDFKKWFENNIFKKPSVKKDEVIKILFLTPYYIKCDIWSDFGKYGCVISASVVGENIGINSINYGRKLQRVISPGSIIYLKVEKAEKVEQDLWLKPKRDDFIGCNLMVYTKTEIA